MLTFKKLRQQAILLLFLKFVSKYSDPQKQQVTKY